MRRQGLPCRRAILPRLLSGHNNFISIGIERKYRPLPAAMVAIPTMPERIIDDDAAASQDDSFDPISLAASGQWMAVIVVRIGSPLRTKAMPIAPALMPAGAGSSKCQSPSPWSKSGLSCSIAHDHSRSSGSSFPVSRLFDIR